MYPTESLYYIIPLFVIALLLMRKAIYSIFDPLVLTAYILSSSVGLMFYMAREFGLTDMKTVSIFLFSHFLFFLGLNFGNKTPFSRNSKHLLLRNDYLKIGFFLLVAVTVGWFVIMSWQLGINILQSNPDLSRTTQFIGGGGIFRRIIPSSTILAFVVLLVLNFYRKIGWFLSSVFFVLFAFIMISFASKGALFIFFISSIFYWIYLERNHGIKFSAQKKLIAILLISLVLVSAFGIVVSNTMRTNYVGFD